MNKRILFTAIVMSISMTVFGQLQVGAKLNIGLNYFVTNLDVNNNPPPTQKFSYCPAFNGGLFVNYYFSDKYVIGSDFIFNKVTGKEKLHLDFSDTDGNLTGGYYNATIWRDISYISFPVFFGFKLKKTIVINIGAHFDYLISSKGHSYEEIFNYNEMTVYEKNYDSLHIDKCNYGARIGLMYPITKRFAIDINYCHIINNMFRDDAVDVFNWRYQHLTVGFKYSFIHYDK